MLKSRMTHYRMPYNDVRDIEMHERGFTLYGDNLKKATFPTSVMAGLIMIFENILQDIENKEKPSKRYWASENTIIYTKYITELIGPAYAEIACAESKVVTILQVPVEFTMSARHFHALVLHLVILNRIRKDDSVDTEEGPGFRITPTKSITFHADNKFTIVDKAVFSDITVSNSGLIEMIIRRDEILAYFETDDPNGLVYWADTNTILKTTKNPEGKVFAFWAKKYEENSLEDTYEEEITLSKNAFELLLNVILGAPMWKTGMSEIDKIEESRMIYWVGTPFNRVDRIEFSDDLQTYTIVNETFMVGLTIPAISLEALCESRSLILSDLEYGKTKSTVDMEYWINENYSIRTGILNNFFREVDCNVVKFVKIRDNNCVFVMHQDGFLELLRGYRFRRKYSRRHYIASGNEVSVSYR